MTTRDNEPIDEPIDETAAAAPAPADRSEEPVTDTGSTEAGASRAEPLVPGDAAVDLKARWEAIQQAFVDDPRRAVTDADALVSELLQRLSTTFEDQRQGLERQWSDGEPSTEDLRTALQRYRDFFERLLTI
jgi:hypothetical protein